MLADGNQRILSKFDAILKIPLYSEIHKEVIPILFYGALSSETDIALLKKPNKLLLDHSNSNNNYIALRSKEHGEILFKLQYGEKLPFIVVADTIETDDIFSAQTDIGTDAKTFTEKWHAKLSHPSHRALFSTLRSFGLETQTSQKLCEIVSKECPVCQKCNIKKSGIPAKLPQGENSVSPTVFNDVVYQDIKKWRNKELMGSDTCR